MAKKRKKARKPATSTARKSPASSQSPDKKPAATPDRASKIPGKKRGKKDRPEQHIPVSGLALSLVERMGANRGWGLLGLAVLSGTLWFLACADFDIWPLAWFAMVPALIAIESAKTVRRAALVGWLAGIVANVGGFYWITGLLSRFGHLPGPVAIFGLLLLCAYQATVFLLFAWAIRQLRVRAAKSGSYLPMALAAPVVMVAFEIMVPFVFPWYLAITQAWVTPVIQIAEFTGPVGVTALLLMVNGALYDVITAPRGKKRWMPSVVAAGVLGCAVAFGLVRMGQIDSQRAEAPTFKVGVVQGNIPFDEKGYKNPELAPKQLRGLQTVSADLDRRGADLIVWSESSYPYMIPRDATSDFAPGSPYKVRKGFEAPIIFGAVTRERSRDASPYNSAVYINSDDKIAGRFDKIFLLLFGEYIPFKDLLEPVLPKNAGHFNKGSGVTSFEIEHQGETYRLGPMICYEDILADFGRKLGALHPHLLVNITNDAWFGDTSEPWEHLALSVFRSVESRTDMIRAVNTGVSAFVDANGRVVAQSYAVDPHKTPREMSGHLFETKLLEGGHTFYARFGNVFGWLCVLLTLMAWIGVPLVRRFRGQN